MIDQLILLFCILQVLDVYTTHIALSGPNAHEANPVMRKIFEACGGHLLPLIVMKTALCAAVYQYVQIDWLLGLLVAFYVLIVGNNIRVLRKLGDRHD